LKLGKCLEDQWAFDDESNILAELKGAGGAPLLYCVCNNFPAMVISYRGGTSLYNFCRYNDNLSLQTLMRIFVEVAKDLEEIHNCGYIHNDLKSDNVLIREVDEGVL
ncbi:hypothetical protein OTU49_010141, partial [Cherax quadricarinatus]